MSLTISKQAALVKPSSTLAITAKAAALRAEGKDIVGFGAGEPDFDTPENIKDAAIQAIKEGFTKYTPASGIVDLKEAVSQKFKSFNHLNYEKNQIVISNGVKHSLTNVFTAIINRGDEVIIPAPYWLSYPEIVRLAGGTAVFIKTTMQDNYKLTADKLKEAVTDKTKALILNSPCNPTGMIYTREELEAIAEIAVSHDFYVVSDEIYEYLIYGGEEHVSIASLNDEIYKRTITCSGLSKSYAMTGWRVGYTGSSKELAKLMSSIQSHQTSNVNSIAQKAAIEALIGPQKIVEIMKKEFNERRDYIYERVCKIPYIKTLKSAGAFYTFIDISEIFKMTHKGVINGSTDNVASILLEDYGVIVVPCEDFGFPDHIRLSYAISMKQIQKGMDRIETFISNLS
ncbi:MAG: pyridoxal phosphate-dependent aminotransferase [Lachnoclostridium sp.]|jgi:aspartate aminotransferase|nr:pyridoxal phosphate-dependent aminotransferase [Lachnoclostridium sp.]